MTQIYIQKEEVKKVVIEISHSESRHTGVAAHAAEPPLLCTGGSLLTLTGVNRHCCSALVHSVEGHVILFI